MPNRKTSKPPIDRTKERRRTAEAAPFSLNGYRQQGVVVLNPFGRAVPMTYAALGDRLGGGAGAAAGAGYWTPITNGDPVTPEIVFDSNGDCVVGFVPTTE